jgi:hypothetical protein
MVLFEMKSGIIATMRGTVTPVPLRQEARSDSNNFSENSFSKYFLASLVPELPVGLCGRSLRIFMLIRRQDGTSRKFIELRIRPGSVWISCPVESGKGKQIFPRTRNPTRNPEFGAWDFGETRHSAGGLTRRFEIEELVAQDSFRVVYRARDRESGDHVAIRRFLPEGVGGEGYGEEKAGEFDAAVEALAALECPGLRRPVAWGLDPVDRLPFIASEWVEGKTLAEVLEEGEEMPAESGWLLAERALEVQAVLDATGHGWQIDLSAESVLVADANGAFQFSFWVAPFPGSSASVSMVKELASLIELAMGWRGRMPAPNAGEGLASWLRLVRQHRMDATDAKHVLAESKE